MPREVLSILVDNHSGVLTRVASLFGRRGFNIDSLTVSATDDPAISRITIVVHDDAKVQMCIRDRARSGALSWRNSRQSRRWKSSRRAADHLQKQYLPLRH